MNKKNTKKLMVVFLSVFMLFAFMQVAFATVEAPQIATTATAVQEIQPTTSPNSSNRGVIKVTQKILSLLQLVGIALGLAMLIIIGIKMILNAGGKDRPDIKKVVIDYVFGAFCILGATGILTAIQSLVAQFQNNI